MKKKRHRTTAGKTVAKKPRRGALALGSTILVGQAGGRAVERAATKTYSWIKGRLAAWTKPPKTAKKKPAKKTAKRISQRDK